MWIDDQVLLNADKELDVQVFIPSSTVVVLGRSNQPELEVNIADCEYDGVPILKRLGGGGTVVLYSGCVVVSVGCWVGREFHNKDYFYKLNQSVLDCIPLGLSQNGISDLCVSELGHGTRKVGGTSLFRSGRYVLYQLSLICEQRLDLIERYLKHPSQEPQYREGRSHSSFLSSLNTIDPKWNAKWTEQVLKSKLHAQISIHLGKELRAPNAKEILRVKSRL